MPDTQTLIIIGSIPFGVLISVVVDDWLKMRGRDDFNSIRTFANPGRRRSREQ